MLYLEVEFYVCNAEKEREVQLRARGHTTQLPELIVTVMLV